MPRRSESLDDRLRRRILGAIHRGGIAPGGPLPSIRSCAEELDQDHRVVAAAYRRLEEEGLVEIRPRSGVYLAPQPQLGRAGESVLVPESLRWLGRVLYEAWQRGLSPADLGAALARLVPPDGVRVACLESVRDPLHALGAAVDDLMGFPCARVLIAQDGDEGTPSVPEALLRRPPDLALTTVFHRRARCTMEDLGVPVVTLGVNPEWVATLRGWARERTLTVAVCDRAAGDRFRTLLGDASFRVVETGDLELRRPPPRATAVYATHLARSELSEAWLARARDPEASLLDPTSVRDLAELLLRVGLAGGRS